jgi:alpha/beta hydrolase fold
VNIVKWSLLRNRRALTDWARGRGLGPFVRADHGYPKNDADCYRQKSMEIKMNMHDDDLLAFEANGAASLPDASELGYVEHEGVRIWYSTYGSGLPVILLHGGLGHSGNWGYQVPALVRSGYRAVLIDSRGHGRSTRDARPFSYKLTLVLAKKAPSLIAGVFFFA